MPEHVIEATVRYRDELLPAHHESHGTPHAMVRRRTQFELPRGQAGKRPTTAIPAVSTPGSRGASTRGCTLRLKDYGR